MNEYIPTTNPEAVKFLSRAFWHLRNRDVASDTNEARGRLVELQDLVIDAMYKEAA